MKNIKVTRKIDALGRVCIPKEIINQIGFEVGELVNIETVFNKVLISKVGKYCSICGKQSETKINNKYICDKCISDIKQLNK